MFWEEEKSKQQYQVPDDVSDLVFNIDCRELPVDHIYDLGEALVKHLPWFDQEESCAIHAIHLAGSQNGWERPDPELGQKLILSRRTKLILRAPKERHDEINQALNGVTLDIEDCSLTIGKSKVKALSSQGTIFSRHIVLEDGEAEDENKFLMRLAKILQDRDIRVKKALCGVINEIKTLEGPIQTRSIMFSGLGPDESVQLQQIGIGAGRHMGCGIFIPHKGIDAVKKADDD